MLLAQFPLEVHSRGMTFVANLLRDAGHEVVVLGNARPEAIARAAIDEAVDVIGISAYCGGEMEQAELLKQHLPHWGVGIGLMMGGILSNIHLLQALGFACFPTGTDPQDILRFLDNLDSRAIVKA